MRPVISLSHYTMQYTVGKSWFFPQIGRKAEPGEVIELNEDVAETFMRNEPGLLAPVRLTTQRKVPVKRIRRKK